MTDETYDTSTVQMVAIDTYDAGTYAYGELADTASSTLIGRYIQDIQCWADKTDTTTGNIKAVLRDSSNAVIHTFWTFAANSLPGSPTWTANTSTVSTHRIVEGDYFAFETDTSASKARVGRNNASSGTAEQFDTTNSSGCYYDATPSPFLATNVRDVWFKMTYSTSVPSSGGTRLPPPPIVLGGL